LAKSRCFAVPQLIDVSQAPRARNRIIRTKDLQQSFVCRKTLFANPRKSRIVAGMKRSATAIWTGSLKEGNGTLSAPGGALSSTPYSFGSRFESGAGTNPEELIAAAHAGCFAMALSAALGEAGFKPERLEATADVKLENVPGTGWSVTTSDLSLSAKIPGIDQAKFEEISAKAKANCPISRLLKAQISLNAKLV
jgi:osmotically inducible protein OsmC